ncbi:class I SAM-dependent methyltransferase [Amycolatopsis sp. H20-H5]|uniref:class I SAM-dependent methyltransferase n=1 Tax=Amycolatopsis sp. H20-H5 TaxID=3046309 RepID=UPI002DBFFC82|nr:class I SAM-dependent methyltransferase [Amycolatopsis sp. H20-H5]MEC3979004.1 class I SAM-dependent methyltransferase [Amycolatopsis sp. H20-H5]
MAAFVAGDPAGTQSLNGLVVIPTLGMLAARGVLDRLDVAPATVAELYGLATGKSDVDGACGALLGSLRVLGLHGWLRLTGTGVGTVAELTGDGRAAAGIERSHRPAFTLLLRTLPVLQALPVTLRVPDLGDGFAAGRLHELATLSRNGWGLRAEAGDAHVVERLRTDLDGVLVSPLAVAMGMPEFRSGDGVTRPSGPPLFDLLDAQTGRTDGARAMFAGVLDLLDALGLVELSANGPVLTATGRELRAVAANHGVVVSYLSTLVRLDEVVFGGLSRTSRRDGDLDRVINIWGSAGNSAVRGLRRELLKQVIGPLFDHPDLSAQPAGLADLGCGSGEPLREMVEFVISDTRRGARLTEYPLAVVGADISPSALRLASATLDGLERLDGVRVAVLEADVADPGALDGSLRALGWSTADGRTVGAADLVHTQMFLVHDRELSVQDEVLAGKILAEAVETASRYALADGLSRLGATGATPSVVAAQFTVDQSEHGRLVPAVVAAADLVRTMTRWLPYLGHGLVLVEAHVPRLDEITGDPWRADVDPAAAVWGVHSATSQYLLPYLEHELALVLAGLAPVRSLVTGTGGVSAAYWLPASQLYLDDALRAVPRFPDCAAERSRS